MSEHDTTEEENLRIVKSAIEAHNAHDVSHAAAYEAESIVHYSPAHPKGVKGREFVISSMTADFVAFADIQFKVDRMIGEGDSVSVLGVLTGTNTGPFLTEKEQNCEGFQQANSDSASILLQIEWRKDCRNSRVLGHTPLDGPARFP